LAFVAVSCGAMHSIQSVVWKHSRKHVKLFYRFLS